MSYNDRRGNSDRETERLNRNRNINSNEQYAYLSDLERQMMAIQEEQSRNLEVNRAQYMGDMQSNDVLMQSGAMAAAGIEEARRAATYNNSRQPGPGTVEMLGRYGYAQPRRQNFQSSVQPGRNIVVNNNTTIQNDVRVPANIGGPVMGRPIQFKQGSGKDGNSDIDRFKNWMNGNLNKQAEDRAKRDKEYKDRDWSLSRSTDKLFKRLGDITRMIGEKFDPRKIGSDWKSQLKALLFIFITGTIAKHWRKILLTVHRIEVSVKGFLEYFTGKNGKRSQFKEDIIRILGGNPDNKNEGVLDNIKAIFMGDGKGKKGVVQLIQDYFTDKWNERKKAVSLVEFPDINLADIVKDPGKIVGGLVQYVSDVLVTATLGDVGLKRRIRLNAESNAEEAANANLEENEDILRKEVKGVNSEGKEIEADNGTRSILTGEYKGITSQTYDWRGNLRNNTNSAIEQSSEIERLISEGKKTGNIDVSSIIVGLNKLKSTAERTKKPVVLTPGIVESLFTKEELNSNPHIKKKKFKAIFVEKDSDDYRDIDGGGDFFKNFGTEYLKSEIISGAGDGFARYRNGGEHQTTWKDRALKFAASEGMKKLEHKKNNTSMFRGNSSWWAATYKATKDKWNKAWANDYKLDIVSEDDPRFKSDTSTNEVWELYEVDEFGIKEIANRLSKGKLDNGGDVDVANSSFIEGMLENLSEQAISESNGDETVKENIKTSKDTLHKSREKLNELEATVKENEARRKKDWEESQAHQAIENVGELVQTGINKFKTSVIDPLRNTGTREVDLVKSTSKINSFTEEDPKSRIKTAMDYFKKELGLTDEQAAGLCGVLWSESQLKPGSINKAERDGTATDKGIKHLPTEYGAGIAQWSLSRKKDVLNFLKSHTKGAKFDKIEDYGLEDQLAAVVWELKGRPKTLDGLKNAANSAAAADIALRGFENGSSRGLASVNDIDKYTWAGGYEGSMWGPTNGRAVNAAKIQAAYSGKNEAEVWSMTQEDYEKKKDELANGGSSSDGGSSIISKGKGIIESLIKAVTSTLGFGNDDDEDDSKKDDKGSDNNGNNNQTGGNEGGGEKDLTRFKMYTGPITKEFTDYGVYKEHPNKIRPGLNRLEWEREVFRLTGKNPEDLMNSVVSDEVAATLDKYSDGSGNDDEKVDVEKIENKEETSAAEKTLKDLILGGGEEEKTVEERKTETIETMGDCLKEAKEDLKKLVKLTIENGKTELKALTEISGIGVSSGQTAAAAVAGAASGAKGVKVAENYTDTK